MKCWTALLLLTAGCLVGTTHLSADSLALDLEEAMGGGAGSAEDEQAIRQVIESVRDAVNRHDAKAASLAFTRDADFVNALGMRWKGSEEIERSLRARFETGLKGATFELVDLQIRFLKPDVAIAHAKTEVGGSVGTDGQPVAPHNELSLRVLVKQDGKWLVRAFHNTTVAASIPARRE